MRFVAKSTQGVYVAHQELISASQHFPKTNGLPFVYNPLFKLFCWTLHSDINGPKDFYVSEIPTLSQNGTTGGDLMTSNAAIVQRKSFNDISQARSSLEQINQMNPKQISRFFCIDQSLDSMPQGSSNLPNQNRQLKWGQDYHDWRFYKQLERELDSDFEQVLSCLLREGYLIKNLQVKQRETTRIVARLVLHWKHNLDMEQELTAPFWGNYSDPFNLNGANDLILRPFNGPLYGDTFCEIFVHGSYSFLHNLYCNKKDKKRSEYRDVAYKQFRSLIDGILQTHERLQYLSRFYREPMLSKVPSFLLHGNSLLFEQPHTHKLTSAIENVADESKTSEFQYYWQKISCMETKSWKNLMHVHTLRLVLEHDQPKHKNIHCQNANGRYTHIQCRRSLGAISNFIKNYASFALLEDSTYIKFIYNDDNDLREIETSATKGFIVIRINKLLPIVVIYLMFTSGILDSHRVEIVAFLEDQLVNCKIRNNRISTGNKTDNILRSKTIYPSSESCCVLIRSPLERMLKVYSRNFVTESMLQNPTLGLPGSCPYIPHAPTSAPSTRNGKASNQKANPNTQARVRPNLINDSHIDDYSAADSSMNRYNLVFGKYLYGVRVVHTIAHLPQGLVQSLASNILAKISAILVNARIKQGFHIAFNHSGILNLVAELMMKDLSHESVTSSINSQVEPHCSTCLCQYIVFPPAVINSVRRLNMVYNNTSQDQPQPMDKSENQAAGGSRPSSLSGSLANSDHSYLAKNFGSNQTNNNLTSSSLLTDIMGSNIGEVKIIREYWIEQQYGISAKSDDRYHKSLENMRYPEIVDHLYLTDTKLFDCLLTYEILQLLCDKLSPFHELDVALYQAGQLSDQNRSSPTFEVENNLVGQNKSSFSSSCSSSSSKSIDQDDEFVNQRSSSQNSNLPSKLIEGTAHNPNTHIPLIELSYNFSIVRFLDYCQQARLSVLLFNDRSEFYSSSIHELECSLMRPCDSRLCALSASKPINSISTEQQVEHHQRGMRKMSVDIGLTDQGAHAESQPQPAAVRREHRASYSSSGYPNGNSPSSATLHGIGNNFQQNRLQKSTLESIVNQSLNHIFLETLHKRLRQMHDKELKLTQSDRRLLADYLKRRQLNDNLMKDGDNFDTVDGSFAENSQQSDTSVSDDTTKLSKDQTIVSPDQTGEDDSHVNWRCFMRKRNQENMMIVFVPKSLADVDKWMQLINQSGSKSASSQSCICPIFVFRCSSTMLNERVLSFLYNDSDSTPVPQLDPNESMKSDISLHFGQPCKYNGKLLTVNDELDNDTLPLSKLGIAINAGLNQSDEKTIEIVHFRAFLRKIKNTVLKSRFSSLNDAYSSELYIHKDDLLYYIRNVDLDTQKKYHVSTQLKNVSELILAYEDYIESLPRKSKKPCNQLLNSILLQKCGIFVNQPIARFDEANPLMKQLHDQRLLFMMRCNYKIDLPVLEESLLQSKILKSFVFGQVRQNVSACRSLSSRTYKSSNLSQMSSTGQYQNIDSSPPSNILVGSLPSGVTAPTATAASSTSSSLNNQSATGGNSGAKLMEMRYGSSDTSNRAMHENMNITNSYTTLSSSSASASGFASALVTASSAGNQMRIPNHRHHHQLPHHHHQHHHHHHPPHTPHLSASSSANQLNVSGLGGIISPTNDSFILEAFKNASCSMEEISFEYQKDLNSLVDTKATFDEAISLRHEAHMAEVLRRKSERRESHQYRRVLKSKTNYSQSHSAIDQALKRVDSLGRLEHFCLTPLLFSPTWRSKLAPVRDHTLESYSSPTNQSAAVEQATRPDSVPHTNETTTNLNGSNQSTDQGQGSTSNDLELLDEKWHQVVCNNYIKEYEQYIQTLGFNSVQIRNPFSQSHNGQGHTSGPSFKSSTSSSRKNSVRSSNMDSNQQQQAKQSPTQQVNRANYVAQTEFRRYQSQSVSQTPPSFQYVATGNNSGETFVQSASHLYQSKSTAPGYTAGYLIKFLNSGCLVFKVGFCRPYVYSILYSIEGERFNNSTGSASSKASRTSTGSSTCSELKMNNMTAFLDELDTIKVTMHLHSFTYDYHLRAMYSYISGRQMTFHKGYHLISFVDDFRKYYQKAPNYARNHILSGEVLVKDLLVNGQQLYDYIVAHNSCYNLGILEMTAESRNLATLAKYMAESQQQKQDPTNESLLAKEPSSMVKDYVLIELKRDKVRYKDGKEPDIFDCALLITHSDYLASRRSSSTIKNSEQQQQQGNGANLLAIKYFLLFTNQRDLYPKLVHAPEDSTINLGCHRPIRLGSSSAAGKMNPNAITAPAGLHQVDKSTGADSIPMIKQQTRPTPPAIQSESNTQQNHQLLPPPLVSGSITTTATNTTLPSDLDDAQSSNDMLLSSGELSGPPSILSTAPSVQSSVGLQFGGTGGSVSCSDNDGSGTSAEIPQSSRSITHNQRQQHTSLVGSSAVERENYRLETTTNGDYATPAEEAADVLVIGATKETTTIDEPMAVAVGQQIARSKSFENRQLNQAASTLASNSNNQQSVRQLSAPPERLYKLPAAGAPSGQVNTKDAATNPKGPPQSTGSSEQQQRQVTDEMQAVRVRHDSATTTSTATIANVQKSKTATICDEEITYLGYFSSDEMDMLRFLQEKTTNLRSHIEKIIKEAEVHFIRDHLWQKLMQQAPSSQQARSNSHSLSTTGTSSQSSIILTSNLASESSSALTSSSKSNSTTNKVDLQQQHAHDPLSADELIQLLKIIQSIDLSALDPQLTNLTTMNTNWYLKLLKAFQDLRQSSSNRHRIHQVKAGKTLLLFIDPKCASAFILLALDQDRGSTEISLMVKDKQDVGLALSGGGGHYGEKVQIGEGEQIDLDPDCRQLINDFVNFCAAFMWSTFLTG